jgi:hypothetical protein
VLVIRAVTGLYPDTVLLDGNRGRGYESLLRVRHRKAVFVHRPDDGKPEVIGSSAGLVARNALFIEPIRSRMSAIQETIEKRSGKYVGRFWSSPAFSNPQPNPQKVGLI